MPGGGKGLPRASTLHRALSSVKWASVSITVGWIQESSLCKLRRLSTKGGREGISCLGHVIMAQATGISRTGDERALQSHHSP